MRLRLLSLASLSLVAVVAAGCPAKPASVTITPPKLLIKSEADTKMLSAAAKDADGKDIEGEQAVAWSSSDPAVAAVDPATGKVTPKGSGKAVITAKIGEASGTADVEVVLLKGMKLESPAIVIKAGQPNPPLKVAFSNEKGEMIDAKDAKIEWKTADPNIATVGPDGAITGVSPGSTTVSARLEALSADVAVTVNPSDNAADAGPAGAGPDAGAPATPAP